jgi:hypothetical protein
MFPGIKIVEILCLAYRVSSCTQAGINDFVSQFFCETSDRFLQCTLPLHAVSFIWWCTPDTDPAKHSSFLSRAGIRAELSQLGSTRTLQNIVLS